MKEALTGLVYQNPLQTTIKKNSASFEITTKFLPIYKFVQIYKSLNASVMGHLLGKPMRLGAWHRIVLPYSNVGNNFECRKLSDSKSGCEIVLFNSNSIYF